MVRAARIHHLHKSKMHLDWRSVYKYGYFTLWTAQSVTESNEVPIYWPRCILGYMQMVYKPAWAVYCIYMYILPPTVWWTLGGILVALFVLLILWGNHFIITSGYIHSTNPFVIHIPSVKDNIPQEEGGELSHWASFFNLHSICVMYRWSSFIEGVCNLSRGA